MANHLFFPALKEYNEISLDDQWTFFPIVNNNKKTYNSIDGLARKTTIRELLSFLEENLNIDTGGDGEMSSFTVANLNLSQTAEIDDGDTLTFTILGPGSGTNQTLVQQAGDQTNVLFILDPDNFQVTLQDDGSTVGSTTVLNFADNIDVDNVGSGLFEIKTSPNFYEANGFIEPSNRRVGFNGRNITFTNDIVTNWLGDQSSNEGGDFIVKGNDTGVDSPANSTILYGAGIVRANHMRIYNDGYEPYDTWETEGNPNDMVETRYALFGFFSDAYSEDMFQANGFKRTRATTRLELFSNPTFAANAGQAYSADAYIRKFPDNYDVMDQATRTITGGGDFVIGRTSPTSQHSSGSSIGMGSIIFVHGGNINTDPTLEFNYEGRLSNSEYGEGNFEATDPTYFLGVNATGTFIELPNSVTEKETFVIACSDETTDLATATDVVTFRLPYDFVITEVRSSVTTASDGSPVVAAINDDGTPLGKVYIDAGEKTSTTATISEGISSTTTLDDDSEITIDITGVGSVTPGTGLKIYLIGYRA